MWPHHKSRRVINNPRYSQGKRFFDNPFVTGDPKVRFYAGFPLKLRQGVTIGTLCLADSKPRHLNDEKNY
ncbi:GAF domain-containing protein [Pseudoalteromonas sp. BSi20652]|uniref:GAF domain-containing protein n=1 Tax=Pseudoalteromonas sp. BSi20652 TaxID=388384 RepID=UPI00351CAF49